ncbi:MAG: ankyrin repeat domain-containing protein [Verrucomicrobiales bacterium]|jgi:beta-lactamase regulating signal transducer with metallopeptidase domain/ankyrin repeat protein|nr:ankyrin repeat domain-containing protein [Verrucomicrobiales bacterium]
MNATAQTLLNWLIESTWQASLLALLVVGVQFIFHRTLTARWRYLLWLPVIVRLLIPALPESPASIYRYVPAAESTFTTEIIRTPAVLIDPANDQKIQTPAPPEPAQPLPIPAASSPEFYPAPHTLIFLAWLVVTSLLAMLFILRNFLLSRRISSLASPATPTLQELADQARAMYKIKRHIPVRELANLDSPAIIGLFRPVILLPKNLSSQLANDELTAIFRHEFAHLKRGDLWMNLLCSFLQIIHWFNPVLWWSFARIRHDRELATDALAVSVGKTNDGNHYGQILIKLSANGESAPAFSTGIGILENHKNLRQRIRQIAGLKPNAYAWSFLGIVLILAISGLCLTKFTPEKLEPLPKDQSMQGDLLIFTQRLVIQNNLKQVRSLFQRGLDISDSDDLNYPYFAIANDNNEMLRLLLQHGAKTPANRQDNTYRLALERANRQVINTLMAAGIKFDPLNYAAVFGNKEALESLAASANRDQLFATLSIALAAGKIANADYLATKCQPFNDAEKKRLSQAAIRQGHHSSLQELEKYGINFAIYSDDLIDTAVRSDQPELLNYLFDKGAKPSQTILDKNLFYAADFGKIKTAKILLERGADPNKSQGGWNPYPLISVALSRYYTADVRQTEELAYEFAKLLLDHGANADVRTQDNQSAAWFATSSPKLLRLLLEHGTTVSGTDSRGQTVLSEMIHVPAAGLDGRFIHSRQELQKIDQDYQEAVNLLVKAGADVNLQNPLAHAVRTGNFAIAIALIENGANVNAPDINNETPLTHAMSGGFCPEPNPKLVELLLKKGANPNTINPLYQLSLIKFLAFGTARNNSINKDGPIAARKIVKLLLNHGSLITDSHDQKTEKWLQAAANGDLAALKKMHTAGQAIDTADQDGWTALTMSQSFRYKDITRWLIDNGIPLTVNTPSFTSPIVCAVAQNDLDLVKHILNAKVKPEKGPLDMALSNQNKQIFDLLLAADFPPSNQSIYRCICNADPETARILFEHGAVAEANNNPEHRENVYWAINFNQPEILQMILDHGGDPTRKTTYDQTPLSMAKEFRPEMVPMIEAAIAKWNANDKTKAK